MYQFEVSVVRGNWDVEGLTALSLGENKVLCQILLVHLTCSGFYA